ncbi:hypothetical protein V8B97DRAFT_1920146 [Scleroderma yunnanense]
MSSVKQLQSWHSTWRFSSSPANPMNTGDIGLQPADNARSIEETFELQSAHVADTVTDLTTFPSQSGVVPTSSIPNAGKKLGPKLTTFEMTTFPQQAGVRFTFLVLTIHIVLTLYTKVLLDYRKFSSVSAPTCQYYTFTAWTNIRWYRLAKWSLCSKDSRLDISRFQHSVAALWQEMNLARKAVTLGRGGNDPDQWSLRDSRPL